MSVGASPEREIAVGCYGKQFSRTMSNRSDISEESKEENTAEKKALKAKKESKYYAHLECGSSEEELVVETRSKPKKTTKVFSKLKDKKDKDKDKDKEKDKEKDKDEKHQKSKSSKAKSSKEATAAATSAAYCGPTIGVRAVFGVPLKEAVRNCPSHDGVPVPVIFRLCIEYVTEHGLNSEGIYRVSPTKTVLDQLRFDADRRHEPTFDDPNVAAGLLKLFLRELPESILTDELHDSFENALETGKTKVEWLGLLSDLVERLPPCNKHLLAYLFSHMDDVMKMQEHNKMTLQCVGLVLQPALKISQRLLKCFLEDWRLIFAKVDIKRYVSPIRPSRFSQEVPTGIKEIQEELAKQESLLRCLHDDLAAGVDDKRKTDELWDVQTVVTQLKRELKRLKKQEGHNGSSYHMGGGDKPGPCLEMFEEKQLLADQMLLREQIAAEQKAIDELRRLISDVQTSANGRPIELEQENSENEFSEDEWKQMHKDLEEQRDRLISSIIDERYKCAHIRAKIEMLTLSKQKEEEATRL